jgi:hypothetical protein
MSRTSAEGRPVLVLGVTSDDKGAQLEALIRTVLEQQGYKRVRSNVVHAGGNELDVEADRESPVVGGVQVTPLMCEAKAYADPVNMPTWQKFLGKLFIERAKDGTTIGTLVALNGINGNVAGSYKDLKAQDRALFVFEGGDLEELARSSGELAEEPAVVLAAETQFHNVPQRVDTAYYGGAYYWVVWWKYEEEYAVIDARGDMLPTEDVERLRPALEASLPGVLLATEEARAEAQARHDARMLVMGRLFRGLEVSAADDAEHAEAVAALGQEPFCRVEDGRLELLPPGDLDADAISRLFLSIFEDTVKVARLSFMAERNHAPYIDRLVDLLPDLQAGFGLDEAEAATLRDVAVLFPSVWVTVASKIPMITTHRANTEEVIGEGVLASDRTSFWEAVIAAIRSDYSNQRLRGFLYDYMGVAELQERGEFIVKGKEGPVGQPITTEFRDAVRQYADESVGESSDPVYVLVRILPTIAEPWEDQHPEPEFPLDDV